MESKVESESERISVNALKGLIDLSAQGETEGLPVNASLLEICRAMGAGIHLDEVLDTILRLTVREMRAQQGSILLFDEHQDQLRMLASVGLPDEIVRKGYIPRKGSIAEWVIERREPLILNDHAKGREFQSLGDDRRIVSSMCVPLIARGDVLGTINLNRTTAQDGPFVESDLSGMAILASQAAIYIENSKLHESCLKSERLAAIGQTVAGISHCIKNLLTGLKGGLSLCKMARDNDEWEMLDQGLEVLSHSSDRVSGLILDMLEFSKEREPEFERVDLDELLKEIKGVIRKKAGDQGTKLVCNVDKDAHVVAADGRQLFRCLLNLVQNALDANREGGTVTVSTSLNRTESARNRLIRPAEAVVVIRVTDEGDGVSEEHRAKIFEPFFSTKGSRGTGLGLAVTRKIIQEHGGELELDSGPHEPASFAIYLPAEERN
jgi:signal transduction histidine kinase